MHPEHFSFINFENPLYLICIYSMPQSKNYYLKQCDMSHYPLHDIQPVPVSLSVSAVGAIYQHWKLCCTAGTWVKYRQVMLVRAECVRCPWLLAETKVATILGIFLLFSFLLLGVPLFKTPEGVVVGFQIFAWAPK